MARFEVPDGWVAQGYRFALDPTPAQARALSSHAGGGRFAHNHMLALVKAVMDQRAAERTYGIGEDVLTPSLGWSLPALRKAWNAGKNTVAPWWTENSKEAYNTGLDALARGLDAWSKSGKGERAGKTVGFPRFKTARCRRSVRFTTGTIRVEADRHHVTLPRVGRIRRKDEPGNESPRAPSRAWAGSAPTSPPPSWCAGSRPVPPGCCLRPPARTRRAVGTAPSRPLCGPRPVRPTRTDRPVRWWASMLA